MERDIIRASLSCRPSEKMSKLVPAAKLSTQQLWQQKLVLAALGARYLLAHVSNIEAIALTGSVAWGDVQADDDLDYLIITTEKRVFTVRWGCFWQAHKMGKKRRFGKERDSWCLNLFLSTKSLYIPTTKQSRFGAYQLLRLRPLYDPHYYCQQLLDINMGWIKKTMPPHYRFNKNILPEAILADFQLTVKKELLQGKWGDLVERVLFYVQWLYQRRRQTREVINQQQIFFHPLLRE